MISKIRHIVRWISALLRSPSSARFILPWLKSILSEGDAYADDVPWMTFEAQSWLKEHLTTNQLVFEYGSGGSTIFLSKRVKELISVEHDKNWYQRVLDKLKREKLTSCKLLLRQPEHGLLNNFPPSDPKSYLSAAPSYRGMNFKRYVTSIEKFPDEYFDLVIVDGRARPSCMASAKGKIRPKGCLLLDDSDRRPYNRGKELLKNWHTEKLYGLRRGSIGFGETTIWKKKVA